MKQSHITMFKPYVSKKAAKRAYEVLQTGWIGEGQYVKEFEDSVGKMINSRYCLALNSGTAALHLTAILANFKQGDEFITTAQTMMASTIAFMLQNGKPVFADIQYNTGNIDPNDIEHRITKKTKAIVVVHWSGYPCDMDEIHKVAKRYKLIVIEDAARALGASYKEKMIGSISPYTCFSFQAIKDITSVDGGMIVVPSAKDYDRARRLRWFGIDRLKRKPSELGDPHWNVREIGYKYHMNDVNAVIGIENLLELKKILKRKVQISNFYRSELGKIPGITLFENKPDRKSSHWLFDIHVEKRLDFIRALKSRGIDTSVVNTRIDLNDAFGGLRKDLPILDKFTDTHLCIPIHTQITDEDAQHIINSIKKGW